MKKFVAIYNAPAEAMAKMATATDEEKAAGMKPWMAWKDALGEKLVDMGNPFMPGQRLTSGGEANASGTEITGYSIVQASDLDEAKSLFRNHPHLGWTDGCTIDLHECVNM